MYRFSRFGTILGVLLFLSLGVLAGRWYLQHEPRSSVPMTASRSASPAQKSPEAPLPLGTPTPSPPSETVEKPIEPTATSAPPQKAAKAERAETTRSQPGTAHPHPESPASRPVAPPGSRIRMDTRAPAPGDDGVPEDPDDPASDRRIFSPKVLRSLFQKRLEALRYLE